MTRDELVQKMAEAMATMEGFYLDSKEPSLAQRNCNPGNIRTWKRADGSYYPQYKGYVDFVMWAFGDKDKALTEGWRVLRKQINSYVDGKLHGGKSPTLYQMFEKYAPSADNNHPKQYAEFVASRVGIPPDKPLKELIEA